MLIQVFGTGCAKCAEVESLVRAIVEQAGVEATVEKVSDFKAMMKMGILTPPAVAIDGVVKMTGRVPTREEIKEWIGA